MHILAMFNVTAGGKRQPQTTPRKKRVIPDASDTELGIMVLVVHTLLAVLLLLY